MKRPACAAVFLFAFLATSSLAQDPPAPTPIARLQELVVQRPDDATLWFFLARAQAQAGDVRATVASLAKLNALGDGYLPSRSDGFEKVWNEPAFIEALRPIEAKLARMDYAPV